MDLCIVNSATFWNIWAELWSGKLQYIINMIQNPNWSHGGGSLCLFKSHNLFLTGLKTTTMNKDLLYFQLCFANNTRMQFPLSDVSFLLFLFSNHCTHVHFLVQPKDETAHQLKLSCLVGSPALIRTQLTPDSLLTQHFLTLAYRCVHPSDEFGRFSSFMEVFTFVPSVSLLLQLWRLRAVDITHTHHTYKNRCIVGVFSGNL